MKPRNYIFGASVRFKFRRIYSADTYLVATWNEVTISGHPAEGNPWKRNMKGSGMKNLLKISTSIAAIALTLFACFVGGVFIERNAVVERQVVSNQVVKNVRPYGPVQVTLPVP